MSTASSLAQVPPASVSQALYEFTDSPLLQRQQQQESNARSYPRRTRWRSSAPGVFTSKTSKADSSSTAWPAPAPWRWAITTRW